MGLAAILGNVRDRLARLFLGNITLFLPCFSEQNNLSNMGSPPQKQPYYLISDPGKNKVIRLGYMGYSLLLKVILSGKIRRK